MKSKERRNLIRIARRGGVQSCVPCVTNIPSRISIFSCSRSRHYVSLFAVFLSSFSHFSMYTVVSLCVVFVLRVIYVFSRSRCLICCPVFSALSLSLILCFCLGFFYLLSPCFCVYTFSFSLVE